MLSFYKVAVLHSLAGLSSAFARSASVSVFLVGKWKRRGRDLNPGGSFWPPNSLAVSCNRPLCHLSPLALLMLHPVATKLFEAPSISRIMRPNDLKIPFHGLGVMKIQTVAVIGMYRWEQPQSFKQSFGREEQGAGVVRKGQLRISVHFAIHSVRMAKDTAVRVHQSTKTGNLKVRLLPNPRRNIHLLPYLVPFFQAKTVRQMLNQFRTRNDNGDRMVLLINSQTSLNPKDEGYKALDIFSMSGIQHVARDRDLSMGYRTIPKDNANKFG